MRFSTANDEKVTVNREELEDIDSFVYFEAKITISGGPDDDIIYRLRKARVALGKLMNIWRSSQMSNSTKIRIFKSTVIAVLLYIYGCESWRITKGDEAKLDTFQDKCLCRLSNFFWPMWASECRGNMKLNYQQTGMEKDVNMDWTWYVLWMNNSSLTRAALTWAPEGKHKRGRPTETWHRRVEKERMAILGYCSWVEAGLVMVDRVS